jgi:tripartite-type tricarboxylate transporter receptor subunit TctC
MAGAFSRRGFLASGAGALIATSARAQASTDFYKGKTITVVVSSSPGGGYDIVGRTIARHLGRHIPGNPRIVVSNMPGAGGIVEMNYFYRSAPKDGTYIAGVQNNTPFEPLFGTTEARYEAAKFNWLGSPSTEVGLIAVWKSAPANSIADMRRNELSMGTSGVNSTPSLYARLINETLGTKMKIIAGYPGLTEIYLAMERGEVDGFPSLFFSTLNATRPNWRREKNIKLLLQYGLEKEPSIPDVPSALDLVTDPDDRLLLQASFAEVSLGRPYLMPPGVPADRVALMRKAFADTFADPAFLADARKMSLDVDTPKTGLEIQRLVEDTYRAPPKVIDRLRKLSLH